MGTNVSTAVLSVNERTLIHDHARELQLLTHSNYTIQYVQYICG